MTVTTLDQKVALIVIDLQKGIFSLLNTPSREEVVKNVTALTIAFRNHGLPVVLVNVAGIAKGRTEQKSSQQTFFCSGTDFIQEIHQQPEDHVVTKFTPGEFTKADLEAHLRSLAVTQVVIVGVSTSNGVEVTARQAYELRFNVALATDAMTDLHPDAHTYSVTHVFPRIGETGTTQEIIDLLKRSNRP